MVEWYTDGETLTVLTTTVALPYTSKDSQPLFGPIQSRNHARGVCIHMDERSIYGSSSVSLELNAPIPLGDFPFAPCLVRRRLGWGFFCFSFCLESFFFLIF